ncbi:hypothetical protein LOTGIDRAFT_230103 [Lottia gigantea]|uniref:Leucine-rich repeat-containing protein 14 n=1 Tax=Lottia gigantea TaxID=225164 RepID=V4B809_LOTGI|nr:hypothetical protein LOTGIDRAFT_230103 [Lottia gigantea]ESP03776.1 hypothetical protein LOTGIDRAFT_230103 [Lottia gigantea]
MEARTAVVWVDNYSGSIYPVDFESEPTPACQKNKTPQMKSLVDTCCNYIVRDSSMTLEAIETVPKDLCIPLMKEALLTNKDRAMEVLLTHWPMESFSLKSLAPNLFTSLMLLYNDSYLSEVVRQGMRYTTTLVHRFIQGLKKGHPNKLKYLDLTGYPTAEVVLFYLSTHCLLAHNETRRKSLVEKFNEAASIAYDVVDDRNVLEPVDSSFPDNCKLIVKLDAFVTSESTFAELCKALKVSTFPASKVQLCIQRLGAIQLGAPAINLILRQMNTKYVTALQLHYNSLTCDDFVTLIPSLKNLSNLTSIDLACNNMNFSTNVTSSMHIAECLGSLPKLVRLDLSNNRVKCLLRQLLCQVTQPLQYLRLASCALRLNDVTYLSLSHHAHGLQELCLGSNGLNGMTDELRKLFKAVKSTLKILDIEDCSMLDQDLFLVQSYIADIDKLLFVNLAENILSVDALKSFVEVIAKNISVQCVRLSYPRECYLETRFNDDSLKVLLVNDLQNIVNKSCKTHPRTKPIQIILVESSDVEMMDLEF